MSRRVYTRKFDWDEARRRYESGETESSIARALGVSASAVRFAVDDAARKEAYRAAKERIQNGTCPECGSKATRSGKKRQSLCQSCSLKARSTSVREDTLLCTTCQEWKTDDKFPHSRSASALRRGRHNQCTPCGTKARTDWRKRNAEHQREYWRDYQRRKRAAA